MGNTVVYTWPKASATAVALVQTLGSAGALALNGLLVNPSQPANGAIFPNQMRVVSLTTSGYDDSGANITIVGTLNGAVVTSTIAGPNNTTVETTQLYDSVTSVSSDAAITAMSVGTGSTGATKYWAYDTYSAYAALCVACIVTTTISYTLQVTDDDVQTNSSPTFFNPVMALTAATTSQLAAITPLPIRYLNLLINSSSGNGAVTMSIIQQGVRS